MLVFYSVKNRMVELALPVDVSKDELDFSSEEDDVLLETLQEDTETEGGSETWDEDEDSERDVHVFLVHVC